MGVEFKKKAEPVKLAQNIQNISNLDINTIISGIEYTIFADHEFPMEHYVAMQPIIRSLAELTIEYADGAVMDKVREVSYDIARHLQEEVGKVVYDALPPMVEVVEVKEEKTDISKLMEG